MVTTITDTGSSFHLAPSAATEPPTHVLAVIDAILVQFPDFAIDSPLGGLFVADHNHGDARSEGAWSIALEGAYEWPWNFTEAQFTNRTIPTASFVEPITGWCLGVYPA